MRSYVDLKMIECSVDKLPQILKVGNNNIENWARLP